MNGDIKKKDWFGNWSLPPVASNESWKKYYRIIIEINGVTHSLMYSYFDLYQSQSVLCWGIGVLLPPWREEFPNKA